MFDCFDRRHKDRRERTPAGRVHVFYSLPLGGPFEEPVAQALGFQFYDVFDTPVPYEHGGPIYLDEADFDVLMTMYAVIED